MKLKKLWHIFFLIGIFFKGLDGLLEFFGGMIFLFIRHGNIAKYTRILLQHEIIEDPNDIIANYLINFAGHISRNTEIFASLYLLVHGIIKISIILGLYTRKLWVYPLAEFILSLFVIYQIYRFCHTFSILLIFLSIIDLFIIFLIWTEYRRLTGLLISKSA